MSQHYHVYGMGNALLDMEFDVSETFLQKYNVDKGVMTLVDVDRQHELMHVLGDIPDHNLAYGGSAANSMMILRYLGADGFYTCKIASDKTGDLYYRDMKRHGLQNTFDHKDRPEGYTGKCLVMSTADADRTMNTFLGISETLSVDELYEPALAQSQYLYIEGYLMTSPTAVEAVKKAHTIARKHGVKVAISLSDPFVVNIFKEQFNQILGLGVDLIFANEEEALSYTGTDTLDAAVSALQLISHQFVITRGPHGSVIFDGDTLNHIDPVEVEAIDTLGAGDMYAGSFLAGITKHGMSMIQAGELANRISAMVVTQYGPRISKEAAMNTLLACKQAAVA